jgi:hypothetical protein
MDLTARILVIDDTPQKRAASRRDALCRVIQGHPRAVPVTSPLALHPDHSRLNIHLRIDGASRGALGPRRRYRPEQPVLLCWDHLAAVSATEVHTPRALRCVTGTLGRTRVVPPGDPQFGLPNRVHQT